MIRHEPHWYRLGGDDDRTPIRCPMLEAAPWCGLAIAKDHIGPLYISTVFLALDHGWFLGEKPVLFETMIFGDNEDSHQRRYSTWAEAERGHRVALRYAKRKLAKAVALLKTSNAPM